MATRIHFSRRAYWLGHEAGRAWRGYRRLERRLFGWLTAKGWPAGGAGALLWIVKLGVLGVLLYVAFWVAFWLVLAVMCLWMAANADLKDWELEQRHGQSGFGWYDKRGIRVYKDENRFDL